MSNHNENKNKYKSLSKNRKRIRRKSWLRIFKYLVILGPINWRGKKAGRRWDYGIDFVQLINFNQIADKAASVVYYLLLAFFPFLMLIMFFVSIIGRNIEISVETIERLRGFLPGPILNIVESLTKDIRSPLSTISLIVTVIMALWASSRGIGQVFKGISGIYPKRDNKLPIPPRIFGIVLTIIFFLFFTLATLVLSFGRVAFDFLNRHLEFIDVPNWTIDLITFGFGFFIIFTILFVLYYTNSKRSIGNIPSVPGALFATLGWIALSYFYSFYIANQASLETLYGGLANIIILMLWLNFSIQILLVGAVINYQRAWYNAQTDGTYIKLFDIISKIKIDEDPFDHLPKSVVIKDHPKQKNN